MSSSPGILPIFSSWVARTDLAPHIAIAATLVIEMTFQSANATSPVRVSTQPGLRAVIRPPSKLTGPLIANSDAATLLTRPSENSGAHSHVATPNTAYPHMPSDQPSERGLDIVRAASNGRFCEDQDITSEGTKVV